MDKEKFDNAHSRWKIAEAHVKELFPELVRVRKLYFKDPSPENKELLERTEEEARKRMQAADAIGVEMEEAVGIPLEALTEVESPPSLPADHVQLPRHQLTSDKVKITGHIPTALPKALETLNQLIPIDWLEAESRDRCRLTSLRANDAFLSMTKGMRPASEDTGVHRLRQAMFLAEDYLEGHQDFDHFAGPLALAELAQFAFQLENIREIQGYELRLNDLWTRSSSSVSPTFMELFTGGRCVEYGQNVEFIGTSSDKTPDLRCSDPYPMVVECKRQDTFTKYELAEERRMAALFQLLDAEARRLGMSGVFHLKVGVEAEALDLAEVVAKLVGQRFLPNPARPLAYPWGEAAFEELPARFRLPGVTRTYSPQMLEHVFGWKSDLPQADGICCRIANMKDPFIDEVVRPVGLLWTNISEIALKKRTWAPTGLFGKASLQVPPGEFGMVYVAYVEGGRAEVADQRVRQYQAALKEWDHSDKIRIPISVLCRLHPFALDEGKPELIESNIRYYSEVYGDSNLFDFFPTTIFTSNSL